MIELPALNVQSDQRVGALGRTRSGKTFLMERLLREQPNVIVVDPKHRVRWPGFHLTKTPSAALLEPKTIYRPDGKVPDHFWDDVMVTLQDRGGGVLYIDELAEVTSPNHIPAGLSTIFRLGGEIGVGVWWAAQESTGVSNVAIRQSDILFMFLNIGASDRDKLIKTTGDLGELTAYLNMYEFVVFQAYGKSYDPAAIPVYKYDIRADDIQTDRVKETERVVA